MEQYICIHGHFYQPPRENPWLETIELQDSAYPYHDWNERVTAECYAPNTTARILGKKGLIARIVNNYARISFNFGPTLLGWLEKNAPEIHQAIVDADRESQQRFSGHGSALAQAYNHMIMPLANARDRYTQVLWGIRHFEHHFGRKPEGMWLPEAAVDLATLEAMAELGIRFTILAPRQAQRVRALASKKWEDVSGSKIDTTLPYKLSLPSGRSIAIFFYNEVIAHAVAFERLLNSGEEFAKRLISGFHKTTRPQLVHIATDGETYGHHHRFGDMALAYALRYIESNNLAQITNYGEYLHQHPPTQEVEIRENTSWSCVHGIERWRSNCGCSSGAHPTWNQSWRGPLREALDWLRDRLAPEYERNAKALLKDPWAARDAYIEVILDRSPGSIERFLAEHTARPLSEAEKVTALKLLELQRQSMLMYTSDGWFFHEISGIETLQVMQYAARAMQLAGELFGDATESPFLEILERAQSNVAELGNGRHVYEQFVRPVVLDLPRVTAHFAISSLFEEYTEPVQVSSYRLNVNHYRAVNSGSSKLVLGRARVTSTVTRESASFDFGVLHQGKRRVSAGVRPHQSEEAYQGMAEEITRSFASANFPEVSRLLSKHFGTTYALGALLRDEQRKVMGRILELALVDIQATYRQLYADYYPPMRFLTELGKPIPAFHSAAELILNVELRRALSASVLDLEYINDIVERVRSWKVELDTAILSYVLKKTLEQLAARFAASPGEAANLTDLATGVSLAHSLPLEVDLWKVQNLYYQMLPTVYTEFHERAQQGDEAAVKWLNQFLSLGAQLSIEVMPPQSSA